MRSFSFTPPTDYYDEKIKDIDKNICKLIQERKSLSNSNPGFPQAEYIKEWAEEFDIYPDLLNSVFSEMYNEEYFRAKVNPDKFIKNIPLFKFVELDDMLITLSFLRQYSNCSTISFNIERALLPDSEPLSMDFRLSIDDNYHCFMIEGVGSENSNIFTFVVSPALPDNLSGIKLNLNGHPYGTDDKSSDLNIVIDLND